MNRIFHIFVSSTYLDLKDVRAEVSAALAKAGHVVEGMEIFPASSRSQMDFIKSVIDRCDIYVIIVGTRYGSIDATTGKSYTQLEFEYAKSKGMVVLPFVASDDFLDDSVDPTNASELAAEKLADFKSELRKQMADIWERPESIAASVVAAVAREITMQKLVGWVRADQVLPPSTSIDLAIALQENERLKREMSARSLNPNLATSEEFLSAKAPLPDNVFASDQLRKTWTWSKVLCSFGTSLRVGGSVADLERQFEIPGATFYQKSDGKHRSLVEQYLLVLERQGFVVAELASGEYGEKYMFYTLSSDGVHALLEAAVMSS